MNTATTICTLFEGDYHHGLASLVNSLLTNGFEGRVIAGFRGQLPHWARSARVGRVGQWEQARELDVAACRIVLLPMQTEAHFTNFKPDFMLALLREESLGIDTLLYLDPDICVDKGWRYFQDWLGCGIALCEDVNSPVGRNHPRRIGWRRYFGARGRHLAYRGDEYVNGGCVGVNREQAAFLETWAELTRGMADEIGGLSAAKVDNGLGFAGKGFADCFDCSDQDALNATLELYRDAPFSILPRIAMAFAPGEPLLPHALGRNKPWRKNYLKEVAAGFPPTTADKAFWRHAGGPLRSVGTARRRLTRAALSMATAISRVYRR